jgi:chloride channel, nucleotide-sensitive, 1A
MPPTTIHTSPALDSFTSLTDHQSQTPTSFFETKPVLHFHALGARALIPRDKASKLAIFGVVNASSTNGTTGTETSNDITENQALIVEVVDIFVSSE